MNLRRAEGSDDEEGWTKIEDVKVKPKMFDKDAEINHSLVIKKLHEIVAARGKKRTDRFVYHNLFVAKKSTLPITGFFLTPAAEKTKTQAQNSRKKLKEKLNLRGGTFLLLKETQGKTQF